LKNRLAQKTVELNRTLSEVLDMLDAGKLAVASALNSICSVTTTQPSFAFHSLNAIR